MRHSGRFVLGEDASYALQSRAARGRIPLVFWATHHDVRVPGYEEQGRFDPKEIPGVHVVINGHVHRHLEDVRAGGTLWMTPGNITRRQRSDATKEHIPSALRIDISTSGWSGLSVQVPHKPFDEVFHDTVLTDSDILGDSNSNESAFVAGLAEMLARKTKTAAGLMAFLELNLGQFDEAVASEIRRLAEEVTRNGNQHNQSAAVY